MPKRGVNVGNDVNVVNVVNIVNGVNRRDVWVYSSNRYYEAAEAVQSGDTTSFNTTRQFIRSADIRFKANDVSQSTNEIEDAVVRFGGFVTSTSLKSSISDQKQVKVSRDSAVRQTTYKVENNITIRVPNKNLDTVIRTIAKQIAFLDYRIIKADDVAMQMLANELAQQRVKIKAQRLTKAIDSKGKKLNDIVNAEQALSDQQADIDNAKLGTLSLQDKVNYSTITLEIYQDETKKAEIIALPVAVHPSFGLRIMDAAADFWNMVEALIAGLMRVWPLIIGGLGVWWLYKKKRVNFVNNVNTVNKV